MTEIQDYIKLRGSLQIALCDPEGKVVERRIHENTVVTVGRVWILQQLETVNINTNLTINNLAIGSSTVAPTTGDTGLGNEVLRVSIPAFSTCESTPLITSVMASPTCPFCTCKSKSKYNSCRSWPFQQQRCGYNDRTCNFCLVR